MAKRLDQSILKEDLVSITLVFQHWVGEGGDSDHLPILLELKGPNKKLGSPFKCNPWWLKDESYNMLFQSTWRKGWGARKGQRLPLHGKTKANEKFLSGLGKKENSFRGGNPATYRRGVRVTWKGEGRWIWNKWKGDIIKFLESNRRKILLKKEEQWRLKSRAI